MVPMKIHHIQSSVQWPETLPAIVDFPNRSRPASYYARALNLYFIMSTIFSIGGINRYYTGISHSNRQVIATL